MNSLPWQVSWLIVPPLQQLRQRGATTNQFPKNKKGRAFLPAPFFTSITRETSRRYLLQLRLTILRLVTVRWPCSLGLSWVFSLAFSLASCILLWSTVPVTRMVWPTWSAKRLLSPFNSHVEPLSAMSSKSSPSFCRQPVISLTLPLFSSV